MFLKSCKGRKSCLDPIPRLFINFENLQHHFFCIFIIDHRLQPATIPLFLQRFHHHRFSCFHDVVEKSWPTMNQKRWWKSPPPPFFQKPQKVRKPIIQKRSILALFAPPYIGQYVPVSAMELKWSFLRGPAHKIEKKPFFAKKRKVEEKKKGFEVSTCLQ